MEWKKKRLLNVGKAVGKLAFKALYMSRLPYPLELMCVFSDNTHCNPDPHTIVTLAIVDHGLQ